MKKVPYKDKERQKEYNKKHMEKWRRKNREHIRKYARDWKKKNKEKMRLYVKRYARKLHDKAIDFLGGKCVRCGITDKRVLQINHKDGGGSREFKKVGALKLYLMILNGKRPTDDLDVRCANCNLIYKWRKEKRSN